ncbi:MAG: alpha/beta hydrolase [Phycisphaerales bacterium]
MARPRWPWWKRLCVVGPGAYLAWAATVFGLQERLLFPRSVIPRSAVLSRLPSGIESVQVAGDPDAVGWLLKPLESRGEPAPLAVWFHGNAEIIDQVVFSPEIDVLRQMGFAVLLVEYPGYGRAPGSPSEAAIVSKALALIQPVARRPDIDPARIVYFGRSLGGGAACAVAVQRPPAAIVLLSTFTSVASFAGGFGLPEAIVRHPFRNDRALAEFSGPVLLMHGGLDDIIPPAHSRALLRVARSAELWEEAVAGHNDFPRDLDAFAERLRDFLAAARVLPVTRN